MKKSNAFALIPIGVFVVFYGDYVVYCNVLFLFLCYNDCEIVDRIYYINSKLS